MDAFGPQPRKRPRRETKATHNGVNGHALADLDYKQDGSGSRTKSCTKFFSTSGCPYGEGCHFLHFVPGGIQGMGKAVPPPLSNVGSMGSTGTRKVVGGLGLPPADDQGAANLGGFKTRLCNRFDAAEGCRFGDSCHFAHGEKELRKSSSGSSLPPLVGTEKKIFSDRDVYSRHPDRSSSVPSVLDYGHRDRRYRGGGRYGPEGRGKFGASWERNDRGRFGGGRAMGSYCEPMPPGMAAAASFGASSTAKISIEASLAGAIIGKGGVNAKQICRCTGAKLSIQEHESDPTLRNVEMEGSFEQIQQAGQMVREVLMHRADNNNNHPVVAAAALSSSSSRGAASSGGFGSHNFKTKLCENHSQGTCTFGDRCHFAHGSAELREGVRV